MASHNWLLDTSTFIHVVTINRLPLLLLLRSPLYFPEYVFRVELFRDDTKAAAVECLNRNRINIATLTVDDLDRIASLSAPRKIGLGEMACAIIAERTGGGVLCDDHKALRWLKAHVTPVCWHGVEEVLQDAARAGYIGEHDLAELEQVLRTHKYHCHCDLRLTYLQFRLNGA
jgi:hypothetical protein